MNPETVAHQAPLPMEFSRQEHWSGLSFPSPGDLPDSGIEPVSPISSALQVDSLPLSHLGSPNLCLLCLLPLKQKLEDQGPFCCILAARTLA